MFQEAQIERPSGQAQVYGSLPLPQNSDTAVSSSETAAGEDCSDVPAGVRVEQMPAEADGDDDEDGASASVQHKSDNATVLKSLFDGGGDGERGGGVKGAVSHDRIMETEAVDKVIVRQKAEQIAQQAIAGLRASSHQRAR